MLKIITKEVITVDDLKEAFGISKGHAYKKMREIKSEGDRLNIKGIIHISDYNRYFYGTVQATEHTQADKS